MVVLIKYFIGKLYDKRKQLIMEEWNEYYKNTLSESPSKILAKYFELGLDSNHKSNKLAIDLGCGAGNDTIYLLKKNYKVIAVDKEVSVINLIKSRISDTSKLDFIIESFENIKLNKVDLITSNLSICFCKPQYFNRLCDEITNNILEEGYFVGNFLGKEDDWSMDSNKTFIDKEQLDIIFKDFKIVFFKEEKFYKKTVKGKMKFWHIYQIIARKNSLE